MSDNGKGLLSGVTSDTWIALAFAAAIAIGTYAVIRDHVADLRTRVSAMEQELKEFLIHDAAREGAEVAEDRLLAQRIGDLQGRLERLGEH